MLSELGGERQAVKGFGSFLLRGEERERNRERVCEREREGEELRSKGVTRRAIFIPASTW